MELLASKCLSLIGKSTSNYDLKKKIRKSDTEKRFDTSTKQKQEPSKNQQTKRQKSRKETATDAEPQTARDSMNARQGVKNAQNGKHLAISVE